MWPFHFRLGFLDLGPEQLFVFLGIAIGAVAARRRLAPLGVTDGGLVDMALAAIIGGAIGAKLFYILPLWIRGAKTAAELASSWSSGSAFYGGFLGGISAVALVLRFKKVPIAPVFDAGVPMVPLAFGIGKIGCFLTGCCYGNRCDGFPGVAFAPGSLAFETQRAAREIPSGAMASLPVHPVQLYDVAFAAVAVWLLILLSRRSKRPWETFLAWVAGYAAWRFGIEFLRDDPDRHLFGVRALSDSQVTALVLGSVAGVVWLVLRRRPSAPELR